MRRIERLIYIALVLAGICAGVFVYQRSHNPAEISLGNNNELMDVDDYIIHGTTNALRVEVEVNGIIADSIFVPMNEFEYPLSSVRDLLHEGWNYVQFVPNGDLENASGGGHQCN